MLSAIILAAGASRRMGERGPKQLLKIRGTSLVRRAVETARAVPCEQVIVVLGANAERIMPELQGSGASVVLNEHWAEGISTSLRGGLAAVHHDARAVVIYPSDMPLVTPAFLADLVREQQQSGRPAAMSESTLGVRGVPVVVTRTLFGPLMLQEGDVGGAHYLRNHPDLVSTYRVPDDSLLWDVDRPEDYTRLSQVDPDFDLDPETEPGA